MGRLHKRNLASNLLALAIGLALVAIIVTGGFPRGRRLADRKVVIGTRDIVYYEHAATSKDAQTLGQVLQNLGFFHDGAMNVLLSKGKAGTMVSFVLHEGGWDHPATVSTFEEIGRRLAEPLGGFPIKVRLVSSDLALRREMAVGRIYIGARDEVYYFGSATAADALAVGLTLRAAGFLVDRGVSVEVAKDDAKAVSFVVDDNVWQSAEAVAGFEKLVRQTAPSLGGLPIHLRLLNSQMDPKMETVVQ